MQEENIKNKKKVVVDASFVIAGLVPDERKLEVDKVFTSYRNDEIEFISSPLLPHEALNALKVIYLQKRIDKTLVNELVKQYIKMKIKLIEIDYEKTFQLALKHSLTFYDASYLFVSKNEGLKLLTFDKELQKAS